MPKVSFPRIPLHEWPLTGYGSNIWQSGIPRNKRTVQQIWEENLEKILRNMQQQHFSSANAMANKTEWLIDYLQEHTGVTTNDARTAPDGSKVWIHPYAFKSDWRLYHVVGHEFEHLKHIYSGDMDRWRESYDKYERKAITEYWAYKWNVDHQWFVNFGYDSFLKKMIFYRNQLPIGYKTR